MRAIRPDPATASPLITTPMGAGLGSVSGSVARFAITNRKGVNAFGDLCGYLPRILLMPAANTTPTARHATGPRACRRAVRNHNNTNSKRTHTGWTWTDGDWAWTNSHGHGRAFGARH